ncbi:beta-fructosidase [uncultured Corynebacterium sp.]|uniref:glycoside hydrolase family 32 protein n=1 Tax=uncultured Corynebacterium sp. TaxID=159447 RepID=UPI00261645ED|nr:beta-fructosidase [uncultured Corynebacterium sp.]
MSYRPRFHLTPPTGRLNDPNGVTLIGDTLHVFYQHDPAFGIGSKRTGWGHAKLSLQQAAERSDAAWSDAAWMHLPDALYPDAPYDKNGVYSGGSVVLDNGDIQLFYTGNVKNDGVRHATQNRVFVEDIDGPAGGFYRRDANNPLIDGPAPGYTNHYRDPQIVRLPYKTYRMVLGAQTTDEKGAIVIYTSPDLEHWTFQGPIAGIDLPDAYMYECPNLIRLRDEADNQWYDLIVFCPQYPDRDECVWAVGTLDGLTFHPLTSFSKVDHGTHFYAPQLIERDGEALLLGWMGLPGLDPDTTFTAEGWLHCLTLPRRVRLSHGELFQELVSPVEPQREHPQIRWNPDTRTLTVVNQHVQIPDGIDPDPRIVHDGCALEVTAAGGRFAFSSVLL